MPDAPPSVLIVGSEGLLVEGLGQFFDSIGFHAERHLARAGAPAANPAPTPDILIVLDDLAPAGEARALVDALQEHEAGTKLLLLRPSFTPGQIRDALNMGFHAILLRSVSQDALGHTIRLLLLDETVVPVPLAAMLLDLGEQPGEVSSFDNGSGFSKRELQILAHLTKGQRNKVIAHDLGVSEATVKMQIRHLLRKIGVANRTQAAIWALGRDVEDGSAHSGTAPGRREGDAPDDDGQDR